MLSETNELGTVMLSVELKSTPLRSTRFSPVRLRTNVVSPDEPVVEETSAFPRVTVVAPISEMVPANAPTSGRVTASQNVRDSVAGSADASSAIAVSVGAVPSATGSVIVCAASST